MSFEPLTPFDEITSSIRSVSPFQALWNEAEELLLATRPDGFEVEEIGRRAMCGDVGNDYVFTRLPDMFKFFRADRRWGINPHYWAEKLGGGRPSVQSYSEELLRQRVVEQFVEDTRWGGVPAGTGKHLRTWVLNEDLGDERTARNVLEDFCFQGYEFKDVWEWDFHDYNSQFLWACHAIVWGIGRYDKVSCYGLKALAAAKAVAS